MSHNREFEKKINLLLNIDCVEKFYCEELSSLDPRHLFRLSHLI